MLIGGSSSSIGSNSADFTDFHSQVLSSLSEQVQVFRPQVIYAPNYHHSPTELEEFAAVDEYKTTPIMAAALFASKNKRSNSSFSPCAFDSCCIQDGNGFKRARRVVAIKTKSRDWPIVQIPHAYSMHCTEELGQLGEKENYLFKPIQHMDEIVVVASIAVAELAVAPEGFSPCERSSSSDEVCFMYDQQNFELDDL